MTPQEAIQKFIQIIQDEEYHPDYDRTVEVAKFAYATATGDEIDDLITSVRMRETEAQKEQRIRLTKALSPTSIEMIRKYFRKLRRAEGVKSMINWESDDMNRAETLAGALGNFYAGQSAEEYLFDCLEEKTFLDPNAFMIIERENITDMAGMITGVRVFPITYPSDQIRHYAYRHGRLNWLLIEQMHTEKAGNGIEYELSEFFLYGKGYQIHLVEYKEQAQARTGTLGRAYETMTIQTMTSRVAIGSTRNFQYFIYDMGTTEVPAIRLGAYVDGRTMARSAVTPLEPVRPMLEKLINVGSLHDLTIFLHSIPRRRELVEACDYEDQETGYRCSAGMLGDHNCPACKGTGDKSITSEQDMIRIVLPPNFSPSDLPDLSKFAFTESADVELLRWQQEKIDWLMKFIVFATMTKDAVTMAEVSRTATEMVLNNQDAYDKMQPYAELYSNAWRLIVRVSAEYLEIGDGLRVSHRFPDDFQFETESELITKRSEAVAAGVPYEVVRNIDRQIIRKQTRSQEEADRIFSWERWKPWPDLTDEMLAVVIADREPTDPDRMLRENFARVRREVEEGTDGTFYLMTYQRQGELIAAKLAELAMTIQYRSIAKPDFGEFNLAG